MTPSDLDTIRSRIQRAIGAVQVTSGAGYEILYQVDGTDFTTTDGSYPCNGSHQSWRPARRLSRAK
jgi:hypothetical protein